MLEDLTEEKLRPTMLRVMFTDVKRPDGTAVASGPGDKTRLSDHCPRELTY